MYYNKECSYIFNKIKNLIKFLQKHTAEFDYMLIITSDHGQLLGEYDKIGHGTFLYDELLRVPLFIKYPKYMDLEFHSDGGKLVEYISLKSLCKLILNYANGNLENDMVLYSPLVFSESYGIHKTYNILSAKPEVVNIVREWEKYRIAIYYKGFKGIFNVNDWKFENIYPEVEDPIKKRCTIMF